MKHSRVFTEARQFHIVQKLHVRYFFKTSASNQQSIAKLTQQLLTEVVNQ